MADRDAFSDDMHATLDLDTSDLLLDDPSSPLVERELERLAAMLEAMRAPASPAELAGEAAAVHAFRAATTARPLPRSRRRRLAAAAAAITASLGLGTGLAAAGALPGPAQDFASSALDTVGVHVPDSHGRTPGGVPPTSPPPHETPPTSTPVGPPITPPGLDPTFNPGQSGDEHGSAPETTPPTAPPGNPTQTTGKPADKPGDDHAEPESASPDSNG